MIGQGSKIAIALRGKDIIALNAVSPSGAADFNDVVLVHVFFEVAIGFDPLSTAAFLMESTDASGETLGNQRSLANRTKGKSISFNCPLPC